METSDSKAGNSKETRFTPFNSKGVDSLRLYFGRTPGVPAVRVVKKADGFPQQKDQAEEKPVD